MEKLIKVTRNYQITIPTGIREKIGIKVNDKVLVTYDEKEKVIKIKKVNELEKIFRLLEELPKSKVDWRTFKKEYYESKGYH